MRNNGFNTNAELAYHYFKELLDDGLEHSSKEIMNYVFKRADGVGVGGERLTDSMVKSAIWYHLRRNEVAYTQTRRGFYQKNTEDALFGKGRFSLYGMSERILDKAIEDIAKIFTLDVTEPKLTVEKLEKLQQLERMLIDTLTEAKTQIAVLEEADDGK